MKRQKKPSNESTESAKLIVDLKALETKRKRMEHHLRDSEVRYRRLFETAQDGILILDAETGQITDVNPFLIDMLGYSKNEFLGKKLWEIGPFKDTEAAKTAFSDLQNKGYVRYEDLPLETKDGRQVAVEFVSNVYPVNSNRVIQCNIRDISARKRAEKLLQTERDRLISILETMADGVYIVNHNYDIEYVNPAIKKEFGLPEGRKCFSYLNDREGVCPWCKNDEVFSGQTVRWEWPSFKNNKMYDLIDTPLRNSDGTYSKLEILRDITDRNKIEEALRLSEHELKLLWETMARGVFYQDASGKVISMNPAAEQILGKLPTEFLGETSISMERFTIKEDGSPFPGIEHPAMVALRTGHKMDNIVMGVYNPLEKAYRWINISAIPLFRPEENKPYRVYTIFEDITGRIRAEEALRQSEKLYRSLFENMLDGFAYCQVLFEHGRPLDFVYLVVNGTFEKLTGLKNVMGKRVTEVIPGLKESNPELFEIYGRVALTGEPEEFEIYLEQLTRWFSISVYSPEKGYFVAIFENITDRKQREKDLAGYRDKLEARVTERTTEIANMNERLRTLTHRLIEIQEEERGNIARELHDQIGQSLNIIKILLDRAGGAHGNDRQDLLDQARPQLAELIDRVSTLSLDLRPKILDDLGLVRALEWYFDHFTTQTNLLIQFEPLNIDKNINPQIANTIYRVVQEALTNVARHAHVSMATVELKAKRDSIQLRVEDDGIGFNPEELPASASGGIIGMQERINLLGGTLQIQSKPGAGTHLVAEIPYSYEDREAER